jgi:hypothetical protein
MVAGYAVSPADKMDCPKTDGCHRRIWVGYGNSRIYQCGAKCALKVWRLRKQSAAVAVIRVRDETSRCQQRTDDDSLAYSRKRRAAIDKRQVCGGEATRSLQSAEKGNPPPSPNTHFAGDEWPPRRHVTIAALPLPVQKLRRFPELVLFCLARRVHQKIQRARTIRYGFDLFRAPMSSCRVQTTCCLRKDNFLQFEVNSS